MIEEAYVSFETAKLLKEKGFNEPCLMCYNSDKKIDNYGLYCSCKNSDVFSLTAPTLQMAMKWLREVHHINIYIMDTVIGFKYVIQDMFHYDEDVSTIDGISYSEYEEAAEVAIKYCLKNLI